MKRPRALLLLSAVSAVALSGSALAAMASACSSDTTPAATPADDAGEGGAARSDARPPADDAAADAADGGASTCDQTKAYTIACNADPDAGDPLMCGAAKFDAWCADNDVKINSASYRRAEAMCLTAQHCDGLDRRDCEYRSYATATPSEAQKQIVAAYCQTCEPADPAGCATRETAYDPARGPKSTDDVFTAAWELSDSLDDAIRANCTGTALDAGAALDAGVDAAACLKAFGGCAADVYLAAIPDCPK